MPAKQAAAPTISFQTTLFSIGSWTILRLPEEASTKLPSRGQAMAEATINGRVFQTPLEPDGNWSHWFKVDEDLSKLIHAAAGDTVSVTIKLVKDWPEPVVPADLKSALAASPKAQTLWRQTTTMARWEWVRWVRSTSNAETHRRRVEVAISKMESGKRRPCCWNRNLCTEPSVSKNGVLLEPQSAAV